MNILNEEDVIPDLYHILGLSIDVCKKTNCNKIIHRAFIKKAKVCHPDKNRGNKIIAEIYQMLSDAYDILKDPESREAYNFKLISNRNAQKDKDDFNYLKNSMNIFLKEKELNKTSEFGNHDSYDVYDYKNIIDDAPTQNIDMTAQKTKFEKAMLDLDIKNKFDRNDLYTTKQISMDKIMESRNNEDLSLKPKKIFNNVTDFDLDKFNAVFDFVNKDEKNKSIVLIKNVDSYDIKKVNYSSLDNFEKLYIEDDENYSLIDFKNPIDDLTEEEINAINPPVRDKTQPRIEPNYYAKIKADLTARAAAF